MQCCDIIISSTGQIGKWFITYLHVMWNRVHTHVHKVLLHVHKKAYSIKPGMCAVQACGWCAPDFLRLLSCGQYVSPCMNK